MSERITRDSFFMIDWSAPINEAERLKITPTHATIRGIFAQAVLEQIQKNGLQGPRDKYVSFREYPLTEYIEMLFYASKKLYPGIPAREATRRLAAKHFEAFLGSMLGRTLFGAMKNNIEFLLRNIHKVYKAALNIGDIELQEIHKNFAILQFKDCYVLADCHATGAIEGVFESSGYKVSLSLYGSSPHSFLLGCDYRSA